MPEIEFQLCNHSIVLTFARISKAKPLFALSNMVKIVAGYGKSTIQGWR
jgi:hypothetical protein